MENVAPVRALNRRQTELLQLGFIVLAVGVLMTVIGLLLVNIPLVAKQSSLYIPYDLFFRFLFFVGLIVVLASIAIIVRALTRRKENDLAMITGQILDRSGLLDGGYSFIRNINRPGLGYIDAVLLGPAGALVFRIADTAGILANDRSSWLIQKNQDEWAPLNFNPTKEAVVDIQHLRQYLQRKQLGDVPVFGIIVFTAGEPHIQYTEREPVVPISHVAELPQNLTQQYLAKTDRIPQQTVTTVRRLLLDN